jgi:hypothetical protein
MATRKESRHGKRAEGQVVLSFAVAETLKAAINRIARAEGVTPSEWMRLHLRDTVRRSQQAARKPSTAQVAAA